MRLLGLLIQDDLNWSSNTEDIVRRAYRRLWIIKRLKKLGAKLETLVDVYCKLVRSVLEFAVPVWNAGITRQHSTDIERVQKTFMYILFGKGYASYTDALRKTKLETLKRRRLELCRKFAKKSSDNPKHKKWFKLSSPPKRRTRKKKPKFAPPHCKLERFKRSPIPYLTSLLNENFK